MNMTNENNIRLRFGLGRNALELAASPLKSLGASTQEKAFVPIYM
jgi:hypothetical protein